ncbi:PREDICTED: putative fidgetin-like protein 2 [Chinchilla lanigera]|uniref:putative fidgetin-like protein 2 n=1 Tax=Chinchilla lanigera TaxID=34839 RepID=UPI00038EA3F5|nr:PREDICTED: putative fidgetin-like protein 2 [Chinchilla lanigera]
MIPSTLHLAAPPGQSSAFGLLQCPESLSHRVAQSRRCGRSRDICSMNAITNDYRRAPIGPLEAPCSLHRWPPREVLHQVPPLPLSKMHWTPEHAQPLNQWPEQHLDVSSTTPSPAHKLELPPGSRQRCHYAWAHDDISALTASNLLKRYAEKYSGVLDSPYERPGLGGYGDASFLNGAKGDTEPWPGPEPPYPLASLHEGLPGAKSGGGGGAAGLGGSPVLAGNLPEPLYAGNACGGPSAAPEYTAGYGGGYLAPGAVVLICELDALLPSRDDGAGAPGALQSQLLACLDSGCGARADGVLVVGTTSRPAALDEVTRRRFALRFYVALPDSAARGQILQRALAQQGCALSERELSALVQGTQGFSGGELGQLCQQAAAGAGLPGLQRPLSYKDLEVALAKVGPRASPKELDSFVEWDKMYGSGH